MAYPLLLLLLLQEGIRLPGSVLGAQEQIGERQRVVHAVGGSLKGTAGVRVLNLAHPSCSPGLQCPPTRLTHRPVLVPSHTAVSDQVRQRSKDVRLDGREVRWPIARRLLLKLDSLHRKLRWGDNKESVKLTPPTRVD